MPFIDIAKHSRRLAVDWRKIEAVFGETSPSIDRASQVVAGRLRWVSSRSSGALSADRDSRISSGPDEEYVVCALLHDIGDTLGPRNHADIAAAIVQPFVSEENHWIVQHHGIFQDYYFFHYLGLDREMRENFRGHPYFEKTEEFCRLFDQAAFDSNFKSMPLEAFEPMIQRVFRRPRRSIYPIEAAAE